MSDSKERVVGYSYELATAMDNGVYCDWSLRISHQKPNVPEGSIRNMTPLCSHPPSAQGGGEPEGYSLVPSTMVIDYETFELLTMMTGGGETESDFSECVLWVGETVDDDGVVGAYGLNVSCTECMEEGAITLVKFKRPPGAVVPEWIKCSDHPPVDGYYLAFRPDAPIDNEVATIKYAGNLNKWSGQFEVTHYQEIPLPPNQEQES
jgi:hypothetical protein